MAAIASPSSRTLIPRRHHAAAPSPSTSGDSPLRLLRAHPRHGRRSRGVSVSTPTARSRPFVFSPRAVSDSKSSQTCLDPDASTVCPAARLLLCTGKAAVSLGVPSRLALAACLRSVGSHLRGAFAVPDGKLGRARKSFFFIIIFMNNELLI